jgi:septin family protein
MANLQNLQEETRRIYENYRVHKQASRNAKAVMACCMLPCFLAFAIQKLAKKSMDVLGGKSTIGMILTYNRVAF